uniref:Uncharacterized protein n=1 Tax=Anguilla anguilla TaxID=7936 RepID=A0A0E9PK45_ANGAN
MYLTTQSRDHVVSLGNSFKVQVIQVSQLSITDPVPRLY